MCAESRALQACSGFLAGRMSAASFHGAMHVSRKHVWMALSAAGALVLVSVADSRGFRKYLELQRQVKELETRNASLRDENDRFRQEIQGLRSDPSAMERAAREELGFIKQGEIVLNLE